MKYSFILLFLLLIGCQNQPKFGQITITPTYCKYNNKNHLDYKFKLFKIQDNISEIKLFKKRDSIYSLEYGKYFIEYETIYNQKDTLKFDINQQKLKVLKLCVDKLDYKKNQNILLLDELKNGENLVIDFNHTGCFDSYANSVKLEITKANDKFSMNYRGLKYNLTTSQIKLLREFEIELRSNRKGGCSSIDTYVIFNKQTFDNYTFVDASCKWHGFENLTQSLISKE